MNESPGNEAAPTTYDLLGRLHWGVFVGAALAGALLAIVASVLLGLAQVGAGAKLSPNPDAVGATLFVGFLVVFAALTRRQLPGMLAPARQVFSAMRFVDMLAFTGLMVSLTYLWSGVYGLVLMGSRPAEPTVLSVVGASPDSTAQVLGLVTLVLLAPLAEEVFFRGFLFRKLRNVLPLWAALTLSSALFAVGHSNESGNSFVSFFWGGIMAYLFWATRNLWVTVYLHFLNNLSAAILPAVLEAALSAQTVVPFVAALLVVSFLSAGHLYRHRGRLRPFTSRA